MRLRFPRLKLKDHAWLRVLLYTLLIAAFVAAVWIGAPMTGVAILSTVWLRLVIIGVPLTILFTIWGLRWRKRRRAARELEEALVPEVPTGDGQVLSERMQEALTTLKKSGGRTYLYDLPWYVIIGPPGAGKTTALANSGIEFPLAEAKVDGGAVEGFGGTRYCDWWFAEEAILIDTAGRYTTQDSDKVADETSWNAFLDLLKKGRPAQPINGVILAFSVEDLMTGGPETLARHAQIVRERLGEIHERLKIDFPVYVLFTKADLVWGFREYFNSFSLDRRRKVWGVTFQTKDRKELTYEAVPQEFDQLVARLSDEVMDRLSEEPDGIARISIFGLPGQMALLRDRISTFLTEVFKPTRYKTNAILRGFYFTSGTQEGTPIDQVLGAMSRIGEGSGAFQPSFLSGKGKSFFLHDLLKKVIFEESDWVSFDRRAVRRAFIGRTVALALIIAGTVGLTGAMAVSFWQNATLVDAASQQAGKYAVDAQVEIRREIVEEPGLLPVLPHLNTLRDMPAGYGITEEPSIWEGFGLGQRTRLQRASEAAYSDALERMLRPRMILDLEREIPEIIRNGETTDVYRALKTYMLLGNQGERKDDAAIQSWFEDKWAERYPEFDQIGIRDDLAGHLQAMLALGSSRSILVSLDEATISNAREAIVQLPLVDQAYAILEDQMGSFGLRDWNLIEKTGPSGGIVFETADGSDIGAVGVPALYTYEGFWAYFFPQLEEVADRLRDDQWVLGEAADRADFERQLSTLPRRLQSRYREQFVAAWNEMFANLQLVSMVADEPQYDALAAAASAGASPILVLVNEVEVETRLTRELEGLENLSPADLAAGSDVGAEVGGALVDRMRSRSAGVQRILFDAVAGRGKNQQRVSGSNDASSPMRPIELLEEEFSRWHAILEGDFGNRAIDVVLRQLTEIRTNLRLASQTPEQSAALLKQQLNALTDNNSRLPTPVAGWILEAESDFRRGASNADLALMNRALTNDITFLCRDRIITSYPFGPRDRSLSIDLFGRFFGHGGEMDRYFDTYLQPHVERTADGLAYRTDSPLADRLSPNTLKQFERAEAIRNAFFAGGGRDPDVQIDISLRDMDPSVEQVIVALHGSLVQLTRGRLGITAEWPGGDNNASLKFDPANGRESVVTFESSPWAVIDLFNEATRRSQNGDTLRAIYNIGGRSATIDFTIAGTENPFTMRELREFSCPQSLD